MSYYVCRKLVCDHISGGCSCWEIIFIPKRLKIGLDCSNRQEMCTGKSELMTRKGKKQERRGQNRTGHTWNTVSSFTAVLSLDARV